KLRRASNGTGDQRLGGGRQEKTIYSALETIPPNEKPLPLERATVRDHVSGEIPGKGGGRATVGCFHFFQQYAMRNLAEFELPVFAAGRVGWEVPRSVDDCGFAEVAQRLTPLQC